MSSFDDLIKAIRLTPIIDNHAHPLLRPGHINVHDFRAITTEAGGNAINAVGSSLSHLRGVAQLAAVLQCPATWEDVQAAISKAREHPDHSWVRFCLQGIENILVDDGLNNLSEVFPYDWHDAFTRSRCKRIVRIEKVAEEIIASTLGRAHISPAQRWEIFRAEFEKQITDSINDREVVGFKSVICYRTGLDIPLPVLDNEAAKVFQTVIDEIKSSSVCRLESAILGPWLVHRTCELISKTEAEFKKPLQFHTGLGDNDIMLEISNPAYMQDFIETHPDVPIVILHASYPFTKEAGYLATVYSNVFLDIGEVFPFVSQDGQEQVVREALELCPTEKLLWSTDGHWFPETYLLAILQVREALDAVLVEYVTKGHLTIPQAVQVVEDLLFNTSNKIYHLGLKLSRLDQDSLASTYFQPYKFDVPHDTSKLLRFFAANPEVKFLRLQWTDYISACRARVIPKKQVLKLLPGGVTAGITYAALGLLQEDLLVPNGSITLEYNLIPDYRSLRLGSRQGYAIVECEIREKDGSEVELCPRSALRRALTYAEGQGLSLLMGFEIEVVFMHKTIDPETGLPNFGKQRVTEGHAWSSNRAMHDDNVMTAVEEIVEALEKADVDLEMFHPESAPGQFEFVLPPSDPLSSVSGLLAARETIFAIADKHALRATLYPKPFPMSAGSASHVHLSVQPESKHQSFYAGILKHFCALVAFTYSQEASYERVVDGCWAGGTWVTWGTQNKETALRKVSDSHWELKTLDGLANPYLAMAAVISAGVLGVREKEDLRRWSDCEIDPAHLSDKQRRDLGITEKIPGSLAEALQALKEDRVLTNVLGKELVDWYIHVKEAEMEHLRKKAPEERRQYLIERY